LIPLEFRVGNKPYKYFAFEATFQDLIPVTCLYLEDESIIELMLAIGQHDFFVGEALLVVKNCWGKTFLNPPNPKAPGGGGCCPPPPPYHGSALDQLETLSGPQTHK
jgi:hypothetical protein